MLRFFRFNDPYRLLFVLVAILFLAVKGEVENSVVTVPEFKGILVGEMMGEGKSLYTEVWDSMPPVTAYVQYVMDWAFGRSVLPRHILTYFLFFFQAAFFGLLIINNHAFNESNYLPSFIFSLLCFFSFDTASLTNEIIGSSLLLLAINNLLKEIEFKRPSDETIHNLGFYLGLASLSVFSYGIFFIGTGILLFLFTRVEIRRFSLFVFGFLLPHFMINIWYYWRGNLELLWTNFYRANFAFHGQSLISFQSLIGLCAVPLVYFLFSLIMMRREARLTKYQSQILQVMMFWLLFGLIEIYISRLRIPQALLILAPPLAYFISHYFLLIKRRHIAELMIWIFIAGLISMNTLSTKNLIPWINFSNLSIPKSESFKTTDKKIFVLDEQLYPFLNNKPAGFLLEWDLAKPMLEDPKVYQHVLLFASAFEKDPPEIIFDPSDLMQGIFPYLPKVSKQYKKEGLYYTRK